MVMDKIFLKHLQIHAESSFYSLPLLTLAKQLIWAHARLSWSNMNNEVAIKDHLIHAAVGVDNRFKLNQETFKS